MWRGGSRRREGAGQVFFAAKGFQKREKYIQYVLQPYFRLSHVIKGLGEGEGEGEGWPFTSIDNGRPRFLCGEGGTEGGAGGAGRPRLAACVATPDSPGYASVRWFWRSLPDSCNQYHPARKAARSVGSAPRRGSALGRGLQVAIVVVRERSHLERVGDRCRSTGIRLSQRNSTHMLGASPLTA